MTQDISERIFDQINELNNRLQTGFMEVKIDIALLKKTVESHVNESIEDQRGWQTTKHSVFCWMIIGLIGTMVAAGIYAISHGWSIGSR